ncbi:MAG TPA: S-layer homology domain-containing protein, partial [Chloroflexia bacterium]|nr:S-layer homology domain-containing protein [Chloroflexia bacterium]
MLSIKNRARIGRYTFATLTLLLILIVAIVNLPKGEQSPTTSGNTPGFGSYGPDTGIGAGLSPEEARILAEQAAQSPVTTLPGGGEVRTDFKHDTSPPLRDITPIKPAPIQRPVTHREKMPAYNTRQLPQDPVLQTILSPLVVPTPIANFEGIFNYWGGIPPDTTGDVGPNHYVQMVNVGFQVYSKTGTSLYGPANFNTLFRGFGGMCESRNDGDPVIVYDQLADRWILTQFTAPPGPYFECIAISATGDPTGAYHRYAFQVSAVNFEDYPHFGVWPDAYYMSTNEFANGTAFVGAGFFAFERAKMIAGQTARMIYFNRPPPYGGFLPSDLDGFRLPPAGSPNFFMTPNRVTANGLRLSKFQITAWDPAPVAALIDAPDIPVTAFDTTVTGVPQPNTGIRLDAITDRFMYRLAYRNMGTHEAIVVNHTVDAGSDRAGVRWYEIRNPNAVSPTVQQQSTFAPADGLHRWMGSVAMDGQGNMGLGYSVSSSTLFPSIRYTGRLATDPVNQMQTEVSIVEGGGSQTETIAGRWGDYSHMAVDVDDCTFWYTQEYYSITGLRNWRTRIGSFKFPSCTPVVVTPTPTSTAGTPAATATRTQTAAATPTSCALGQTFNGSLTLNDPVQTGRLARNGIASSCAAPKVCPGIGDTVVRHYDSYTFTNNTSFTQCVTVSVTNNCENNALLSAAYLGSFNPNDSCANYLADMGSSGPQFTYSFNVPPGATYVVTVLENSANVGCTAYTLRVDPCPVGTAVPTVTGTPPTATRTSTALPTNTAVIPTVTGTPPTSTPQPTATPLGCGATQPLVEGFEGVTYTFTNTTTLGDSPWTIVTGTVNSGLRSAHVVDPETGPADHQLSQVNAITVPANAISATMRFAHTYSFENATESFDGGVLEYSTNGVTWMDAGSFITQGGYTGVITVTGGNPLSNRPAWTNEIPGYPAFKQVNVNLMTLVGSSVRFRFRMGADANTGGAGWWVDDISFLFIQPCATGTVTATATRTATVVSPSATVAPTQTPGGPTATLIPTQPPLPTGTTTVVVPSATLAPTQTPGGPTATLVPTTAPTNTVVVPSSTPQLPTQTPGGPTATLVPTAIPTNTVAPSNTVVVPSATPRPPTQTPGGPTATTEPTTVPSATATTCTISFTDVPPDHTFYSFVRCLACRGIISGYSDGTFK